MTEKEQRIVERVKLMLGGDVLKIEVPDSTIYECIQIAMDTIGPYIPDTCYKTTPYKKCIDLSYINCEEVLRVFPGSQSYQNYGIGDEFDFGYGLNCTNTTLAAWSASDSFTLREIFMNAARGARPDYNIPFDYDDHTHKLYLSSGPTSGPVTIEYIPIVHTLDDLEDQASQKWVYLYTLALTKEIIGRIRSKAKSQNVPIQLDGDTLLAEAAQEKKALEEALISDAIGPVAYLR